MSLNLVTGKRGTAHISSADWRSLNRGIVGEGKFFLEDTSTNSKGEFSINASSGEITIPPRSFIWSGMHIRNDASVIVRYVPPTSTSNINLWLHYTKESDSGIENVEFVTTIDSSPYPVADVIEDITTNAYTSVISFVHNAESVSAQNITVNFKAIDSLKKYRAAIDEVLSKSNVIDATATKVQALETTTSRLNTEIQNEVTARKQAISTEATARTNAINAETSARKQAISAETTARNIAINNLKSSLDEVVLFSGNAKPGEYINLSENFRNFRQIAIMGWNSAVTIIPTSLIPASYLTFGATLSGATDYGETSGTLQGIFLSANFMVLGDTRFDYQKSLAYIFDTKGFLAGGNTEILKIVGIGRKE